MEVQACPNAAKTNTVATLIVCLKSSVWIPLNFLQWGRDVHHANSSFGRYGKKQNYRVWASENPKITAERLLDFQKVTVKDEAQTQITKFWLLQPRDYEFVLAWNWRYRCCRCCGFNKTVPEATTQRVLTGQVISCLVMWTGQKNRGVLIFLWKNTKDCVYEHDSQTLPALKTKIRQQHCPLCADKSLKNIL